MFFHPKHVTLTEGSFRFGGDLTAVAHPSLNTDALRTFWKNFTFDCGMEHTEGCLETAKQEGMMGLLHTTWNTLSKGTPFVLMSAVGCYDGDFPKDHTMCMTHTAAVLRKASPVDGDYRRAGWAKFRTRVYH